MSKAIKKRAYTTLIVVIDQGTPCPECGERFGHRKAHKLKMPGVQRVICAGCKTPFAVAKQRHEQGAVG